MTPNAIQKLPEIIHIQGNAEHRSILVDNTVVSPIISQETRNHSPDGFNWGYGGSGPAQTALAILLMFMDKGEAQRYYQTFKFKYVAGWPMGKDFDVQVPLRDFIISQHIK